MTAKDINKINISITTFSILMCICLVCSMVLDTPVFSENSQPKNIQKLNEVNIMEKNKSIFLSEDYIASMVGKHLPKGISAEDVKVTIKEDGAIFVGATADRRNIEDMVGGKLGIKEKMFLKLLPRQFELGFKAQGACDPESGSLQITPNGLVVNGMDLPVDILPSDITEMISQGINKALLESGYYFTRVEFKDGGLELLA